MPYLNALIRKHDSGNERCKRKIKRRLRKIIKNTFPKTCAKATRPHNIKYHINSLISIIRSKRKQHNHKRKTYHRRRAIHFRHIIPDYLVKKLSLKLSLYLSRSPLTLRRCKRLWTNWCQKFKVWDNRLFKHVSKCYKKAPKHYTKRRKGKGNPWKTKEETWKASKEETLLITSWNIDKGFTKVHHFVTEEPQACITRYKKQRLRITDNLLI